METYIIEGGIDSGKSTLIYAQYLRLMNTKKYKLVESNFPHALTGFQLLIKHIDTNECVFFNSPTDNLKCIKSFRDFYNTHSQNYKITKIVTSCRDNNYPPLRNKVLDFINSLNPSKIETINLSPLLSI